MKVYIMRHGEAGYAASSDSTRTLTEYGIQQCVAVGEWLCSQHIELECGLVSPYLRAQQSFDALSSVIRVNKVDIEHQLVPGGSSQHIANTLSTLSTNGVDSVILVSHLPLVGYLVNELCPNINPPMFSTASIACVELSVLGEGSFEWFHHVK